MVVTIGNDHRSFADDETHTNGIEPVAPVERVGLHRDHLVDQGRVAEHDDSEPGDADLADRSVGGIEAVEGGSDVVE